jgi:hypothetical protein
MSSEVAIAISFLSVFISFLVTLPGFIWLIIGR